MALETDEAKSSKRGPSTPLAPSKAQNRRKYETKNEQPKLMEPALDYQKELLEAKQRMWLLERQLQRLRELTKFLELERETSSLELF